MANFFSFSEDNLCYKSFLSFPEEYVMHFMLKHHKKLSQGSICCKLLKNFSSLLLPHWYTTLIANVQKFFKIIHYRSVLKFMNMKFWPVATESLLLCCETEKGHFVAKECCICLLHTDHYIKQHIINLVSGIYYGNYVF